MTIESRKQAQDENTPSETLAQLGTNQDWLTRRYVASNPNTPVKILEKLAKEFPDEVMNNPILDLLILENSDSIRAIKIAVANSPNASGEILNRLKDDSDRYILYAIARNRNTLPETLTQLAKNKYIFIRKYVASNLNIPREILDYLKNDESKFVRGNVALNPNTSLDTLSELLDSSDRSLAYNIKRHLEKNNQTIQQANSPNTSPEILTRLAQSKYKIVRQYVASNFYTPVTTLDYLKNDPEQQVRLAIAQNPIASEKTLFYLRNDEDIQVCLAVVRNPGTSDAILKVIANPPDKMSYVAQVAHSVLEKRQAQNRNTPPEILAQLANSLIEIRLAVAENPNTPQEVLDYLKSDRNEKVRRVAHNSKPKT